MRISDWSSDVCSSDLLAQHVEQADEHRYLHQHRQAAGQRVDAVLLLQPLHLRGLLLLVDRKSVVWGKSVSVRVDLGGRRIIKKKNKTQNTDIDTSDDT